MLLSFLKIRVIINNKDIYPLSNDRPVVIPLENKYVKLVATDGFHFTKPLELEYKEPSYYKFNVDCAIDDLQLLGGAFMLIVLYLLGFFTGVFILKLLSFVPIVWFLFLYYINRREFIRIIPVRS